MSATEKIMDEVRALVVLDVTPESLGQLAALRHTIARTIGDLERARDAALEERTRLGVELAGARTRIADLESRAAAAAAEMTAWTEMDAERYRRDRAQREMALCVMAEADDLRALLAEALADKDDLRAEVERLRCRHWPDTPFDVRALLGSACAAVRYALPVPDGEFEAPPHAEDTYTASAHDIITAISRVSEHRMLCEVSRQAAEAARDAAQAAAERLRAELACYRPAGWLMTAPVQADESPRPAGWKVAPVDPTPEMIDAADSVDWRDDDTRGSVINMWHCMLAVAPEQAEPVGGCSDSVSCPRGER